MILIPSGNMSSTTTSSAAIGPLFTTTTVHSTKSLTYTLEAFTSFLISTSHKLLSTTVVLFAVLFSVPLDDALTVLMTVPFTNVVNHTVKLALSPGAKTPL